MPSEPQRAPQPYLNDDDDDCLKEIELLRHRLARAEAVVDDWHAAADKALGAVYAMHGEMSPDHDQPYHRHELEFAALEEMERKHRLAAHDSEAVS